MQHIYQARSLHSAMRRCHVRNASIAFAMRNDTRRVTRRLHACPIPRYRRCERSCRCRACASSSALRASAVCCACCALLCQVSMPSALLFQLEGALQSVRRHIIVVIKASCNKMIHTGMHLHK